MGKRVKISASFYYRNRKIKKNHENISYKSILKSISKPFKKLTNFITYHYRYNRSIFITCLVCFLVVAFVIISSAVSTFAKLGNNDVFYNIASKPKEIWYNKLLNLPEKGKENYDSNTTVPTSLRGNGTVQSPFQIKTPGDLIYLSRLVNGEIAFTNPTPQTVAVEHVTDSPGIRVYEYVLNNIPKDISKYEIEFTTTSDFLYFNGFEPEAFYDGHATNTSLGVQTNMERNGNVFTYEGTIGATDELISRLVLPENTSGTFGKITITYADGDVEEYNTLSTEVDAEVAASLNESYFQVQNNIDLTGVEIDPIGNENHNFEAIFDGNFKKIKGLTVSNSDGTHAGLFGYLDNGTVKNVILENLDVSLATSAEAYVGGLVGFATGSSKIYNNGVESGTILANGAGNVSTYIGGIVGYATGTTAVVNSYNKANVTSTTTNPNAYIAGILGYRANGSSDMMGLGNLNNGVRVFALVNYGSASISGGNYQYVYNGIKVNADESPTYCYYLFDGNLRDTSHDKANTYAIIRSYDEISSDGFKANLNSYRYLAAYYAGVDQTINASKDNGYQEIAMWDKDKTDDYFVVKKYEKINNTQYMQFKHTQSEANSAYNGKYLKVNFVNSQNSSQVKTIYARVYDKEDSNYDFTNRKIILPFNSHLATDGGQQFTYSGTKNGFTMTLTGWKLSQVKSSSGTSGARSNGENFNYDYTLRTGKNGQRKDIGTVFAQGGYFMVPEGVTEVTFTTRWAYTAYVSDQTNEVVYTNGYALNANQTNDYGKKFNNTGDKCKSPTNPCVSLSEAYESVSGTAASEDLYGVAFVLVGNYHMIQTDNNIQNVDLTVNSVAYWPFSWNRNNEVTIMSADQDNDLVPDYSLYTGGASDFYVAGVRLDFVNVLSVPQVGTQKNTLGRFILNFLRKTNIKNINFETTETCTTDKIILNIQNATYVKLNGGNISVTSSYEAKQHNSRINYLQVGGNLYADFINYGCESTETVASFEQWMPVFVVTGGRINTLSSTYVNANLNAMNKIYFYLDGGYINNFYTTYNGSITKDAAVVVNGSYINNYYSGGHTSSSKVVGGVTSTISNARIGYLYGGPEFGEITNHSNLNVYNSEIDYLYGSGYGGTETIEADNIHTTIRTEPNTSVVPGEQNNYNYGLGTMSGTDANYAYSPSSLYTFGTKNNLGIMTDYETLAFGYQSIYKSSYSNFYSSLSSASVDRVNLNIVGGTIHHDVYGGGNKGIVDGSILMNIKGAKIEGSVYGGGLSNEIETIDVTPNASDAGVPNFRSLTVDNLGTKPVKETYTWSDDASLETNIVDRTNKLIYSPNASILGSVTGDIYVNISDSIITGDVYGGGNLSKVTGNSHINLYGNNDIDGSVYGGGNKAEIEGTTDVRLKGGEYENVYAGGNEAAVIGETLITVSDGTKATNVYGGGKMTDATDTTVYIVDGQSENVFGGSNTSGTIDNSHVYLGKLNPVIQTFKPEVDPRPEVTNPEKPEDPNAGGSDNTDEFPYIPSLNTCKTPTITFDYEFNKNQGNNQYKFSIYNKTNTTFTSWKITMVSDTITSIINWQGAHITTTTVKFPDDDRTYYQHEFTSDGYGGQYTIAPNGSYIIDFGNGNYSLTDADAQPRFKSFVIEATGADGKTYHTKDCNDPIEETPPPEVDDGKDEEVVDTRFVFTYPALDTEVGNAIVTNVYGGNNVGGLTKNANIYIKDVEGTVTNVFGGGNLTETTTTNVELVNAIGVKNIYGGGNNGVVTGDTLVNIVNSHVFECVYGGGYGTNATVLGSSSVTVSGKNTVIDGSVFGGGNKANNGDADNNANAYVKIAAGTIKTNVYGGPNTSVVKGATYVDIGYDDGEVETGDIIINGTVFGGGHANADDSGVYDFKFISVTNGTNINIEPKNGNDITINGSVYGSGNNSTTSGDSIVKFINFGTSSHPKRLVSIQRASNVVMISSALDLEGATDSTNIHGTIAFGLSRIGDLIIANNSTLYLNNNANLLEKLSSKLISEEVDEYEKVTIDPDTHQVTKNVDNRVYIAPAVTVNILQTEDFANGIFGEVNGMAFFGLFQRTRDGEYKKGLYEEIYNTGDAVPNSQALMFNVGSIINGLHKDEHDYTKDGFYTNYVEEDINNTLYSDYIKPTPDNMPYYSWIVGEASITFEVDLKATKFSKDGTVSRTVDGFYIPNTYFEILGFTDADLEPGVKIIDKSLIPRIADTDEEAMSTFGLTMKQSITGWITDGKTEFISDNDTYFTGTDRYYTNNTNETPCFDFYLTNSKNITEDRDLGYVMIAARAYVPVDEVSFTTTKIFFKVSIKTLYREGDSYESTMRPGKEYDMFNNKLTYITSDSALSASFSLYSQLFEEDKTTKKSAYENGDYRTIVTTYELPVNTHITMIDKTNYDSPIYYYHTITEEDNRNVTITTESKINGKQSNMYHYRINDFIKMGSRSSGNSFSDDESNISNYDPISGISSEMYIFIFDFKESEFTKDMLDEEIYFELVNADDEVKITTDTRPYGQHSIFYNKDSKINIDITPDRETAYVGFELNLDTKLELTMSQYGSASIYDTNYIQDKMGLKITILDSEGKLVPGANLLGTLFYIDGKGYSASYDGSIRIKVSDLVTTVNHIIKMDLTKSNLATDEYTIVVEAFGSPDGFYYGSTSAGHSELKIEIVNELFGLKITTAEEDTIIDSVTGLNINDTRESSFKIEYRSQFKNPNITYKLQRRVYDETYSQDYQDVSLSQYVSDALEVKNENEYYLSKEPQAINTLLLHFNSKLRTGTYRLVVTLYSDDAYIGEDYTYIFIK